MKTLIVVDMQNDFITGSLGTPEAQKILPNVKKRIEEYRENGDGIIFTQDAHSKLFYNKSFEGINGIPQHCIVGTWGYEIADGLAKPGDDIIEKSSFGTIDWDMFDLEDVEIVGLCTDICVISNAFIIKAMVDAGTGVHTVTINSECCAGTSVENHNKALEVLKNCYFNII